MRAACSWVLVSVIVACAGSSPPPKQPATDVPLTEQEAQARRAPQPPPPPPPPHEDRIAEPPPPPPPARVELANPVIAPDLGRLPVDSELVFAVDVARLRQGALWAKYAPRVADHLGELGELAKTCSIDPLASVNAIAGGMQGAGDALHGIVVAHGVPGAKLRACIPKWSKQLAKQKRKLTIDHDLYVIELASNSELTLGLLDDATLLLAFGSSGTKAAWTAARDEATPLRGSDGFLALYHLIRDSDPAIALVRGGPLLTQLASQGTKTIAWFGSLDATDQLTADMRFRFATADEANQLTMMMKGQLVQAKQFFDKIDVTNDDLDSHLELTMTAAQLDMLLALIH